MKKIIKWGLIGFIGLVVLVVLIGSGGNSDKDTSDSGRNVGKEVTNEDQGNYKVGEDVVVGEVGWQVISARDRGSILKASESRYASIAKNKEAAGKFIEVTVEVENLGKEMKSVSSLKLVDGQGREFTSASDVSEWIPEGKDLYILDNLNPNVPQQFVDIYEVPEDALGLKLKVGDLSLFGSEEALIDLGL